MLLRFPQLLAAFLVFVTSAVLVPNPAFAQKSETVVDPPAEVVVKRTAALPGIVIYNPKNHHYYQSFHGDCTWEDAYKKASSHTFNGVKGYLASVTSQDEYDFLVNSLFVYDYWIGGYRDTTQLKAPPDFGWRWATGEPWGFTNWNDNEPDNAKAVGHVLSFWTGSMKWSKREVTDKSHGYVVEYPTTKPVESTVDPLTPPQDIDKFLTTLSKNYQKMST